MGLQVLAAHLLAHFRPGAPTAEIGCGPGERTAWLTGQGFSVVGYDTSPVIAEATLRYPDTTFRVAELPHLTDVADRSVSNILCAGVLASVPREDLITAVFSLGRILQPEGRILLIMPSGPDAPVPVGKLVLLLETTGLTVSVTRELTSSLTLIVAEKTSLQVTRGLERIQSVLVQDKKFATYKLALIRAFCGIARNEPHLARWGQGLVYVPMWFVARRWLMYYWPFFTGDRFIAQRRGEVQDGDKPIKFRKTLVELARTHGPGGLQGLLTNLDLYPNDYRAALHMIAEAIQDGPVKHAGTESSPVFGFSRMCPVGLPEPEGQFGWITVPETVWLDLSRFHHWIEDSLILRWAHLTTEMDPRLTVAEVLPILTYSPYQERDTTEVRRLLQRQDTASVCVWTDRPLRDGYEVDHAIPFSVWGNNDWWNLLPSDPRINNQKRDALPDRRLLLERREVIARYWRLYFDHVPDLFGRQVERSLGLSVGYTGWERAVFAGFQEAVERVAVLHGLARWQPEA